MKILNDFKYVYLTKENGVFTLLNKKYKLVTVTHSSKDKMPDLKIYYNY